MTYDKRSLIYIALYLGSASAACPSEGGTFTVEGVCNVLSVQRVCPDVTDDAARRGCQDASVKFEQILGNHYQYDKEFMDGGTELNDVLASLPVDADQINRAANNIADDNVIAWPEYEAREFYEEENYGEVQGYGAHMTNFDLDEGCDLRTVMCCYVDRVEDNGALEHNTDVCHQDLHQAKFSNHVDNGYAFIQESDSTHCVGFSWEDGDESDALKGNALYSASVKYRMDRGYAKNVPGAPMCACIEQMPAVEKSSCVSVSGIAKFTFTYNNADSITGTNTVEVTYGDCGGDDLKTHFSGTVEEEIELEQYLVGEGNCGDATSDFLNQNLYRVPTDPSYYENPDPSKWQAWQGHGMYYRGFNRNKVPEYDAQLRALIAQSPNGIIRRFCDSCRSSHRDVFYKRLTPIPATQVDGSPFYFYDLILNQWRDVPDNKRNIDFNIFSTYEDALNDNNPWTFCNFNYTNIGFPRDCGPTGHVGNQWNSYVTGMANDPAPNSHEWYVELP